MQSLGIYLNTRRTLLCVFRSQTKGRAASDISQKKRQFFWKKRPQIFHHPLLNPFSKCFNQNKDQNTFHEKKKRGKRHKALRSE